MALDWQNPNCFLNQNYPFEQFQFHDPNHILLPFEDDQTDLLCFDPLPPTLFDFDDSLFDPLPLQQLDFDNNDLFTFNNNNGSYSPFSYVDFPPPEEILSFDDDFSSQFLPFPKKQKLSPCFNDSTFVPDFFGVPCFNVDYLNDNNNHPNCYNYYNNGDEFCANFDQSYGDNNGRKVKTVSAQSRAARERRRKITEKTQELGKLIPGGHKMNTAEMFQAASKYVKFMQAQLEILQSIKTLKEVIYFILTHLILLFHLFFLLFLADFLLL